MIEQSEKLYSFGGNKMHNFYIIQWGNDFFDNYNYGAEISFKDDGSVSFSAPFMPTGEVIKSWTSKSKFHVHRKTPLLPLLAAEKSYTFNINATADHSVAMQVRIEFLDISGTVIEEANFSELSGEFVYPAKATSYQLALLNNHHQQIYFYYLTISETELLEKFEPQIELEQGIICFKQRAEMKENRIVIAKKSKTVNYFALNDFGNQYFVLTNLKTANVLIQMRYLYSILHQNLTKHSICRIERGISFETLAKSYHILPYALSIILPNAKLKNMDSIDEELNLPTIKLRISVNELAYHILEEFVSVSH